MDRALLASGGCVIAAAAVIGAFLVRETGAEYALLLILCGGFFMAGLVLLRGAISDRVVLHVDAIEVHQSGMGVRRMERSQIRGFRKGPREFLRQPPLRLIPRRPTLEQLELPRHLVLDDAFGEWLGKFPDLDAQDQKRSMADFLDEHGDGASRAELERRLASAKRQEKVLTAVTWMLSIAGTFVPSCPPALGIALASLPLAATLLQAWGRGAFTIESPMNDVRSNVGMAYILPPMVLLFRAYRDTRLLDYEPLLWPAGLAMLGLIVLALLAIPQLRRRMGQVLLLGIFMSGHAAATAALSNMYFDRGPASNYTTEVVGLFESAGNKRTTYRIGVSPWGPDGTPSVIRVDRSLYRQLQEGGRVCIDLHRGAFGARWFAVRACGG
jgi:hypothetical protein